MGGAALETKGLELRGTDKVVIPQTPFEQGKTEMAFPVLRKSRSCYEFRSSMGRGRPDRGRGAGALTFTPHLQGSLSHLSRKFCFLAMTFIPKKMSVMREREAGAPPSRGTGALWGDVWP